ncbi:MAG: lipoyl(octanoyl) transferase LipB [Pseudomonadota bacterium]
MVNRLTDTAQNGIDFRPKDAASQVEWLISDDYVPYNAAVDAMERRVARIAAGAAPECVWLLEHPPLYTAGTSADDADLKTPDRFPVHKTGRGGQYTYHGPGQRIAYVMLDLKRRKQDVRLFVQALEQWLIDTLDGFNIKGERRDDRVGVWVTRPEKPRGFDGSMAEDKIAALGIRLRKWVSYHGISLNVSPDLAHFDGIVACGVNDHGVTSLEDLGLLISMAEVDVALKASFEDVFGATAETRSIQTP